MIGYWDRRDEADFSGADAASATAADRVVTTLSDALAEIEAALTQQHDGTANDAPDASGLKALTGP